MYHLLLQAESSLYINNTVLIFGVAMLGLLGFWYYTIRKQNPNLDFGPAIGTAMVSKHESIFMAVIFVEYIAAAMIAATVDKPGASSTITMSPAGRVIMHIIISVVGTVAQFTLMRDIVVMFIKQSWGERFGNLYIAVMITVVAFMVPYLNLVLIASATGESITFDIWLWSNLPWVSDSEFQTKLMELGYPPNFRAWESLSMPMHVCIISSGLVHYLLTTIEAARTMVSPQRRKILIDRVKAEQLPKEEKDKKEAASPVNSSPMPGEQRKVQEIESNAKFLLVRLGYDSSTEGQKITNLIAEIQRAILENGEKGDAKEDMARKLSVRLASLRLEASTLDGKSGDQSAKKKELLGKIHDFISGPRTGAGDKRGLGIAVRKKN